LELGRAGLRAAGLCAALGRRVAAGVRRGEVFFTGETFFVPVLFLLVAFGAAFFADFAMLAPN
jgi:hypothetical protein